MSISCCRTGNDPVCRGHKPAGRRSLHKVRLPHACGCGNTVPPSLKQSVSLFLSLSFAFCYSAFNPNRSLDFHSASSLFRADCNVRIETIAGYAKHCRCHITSHSRRAIPQETPKRRLRITGIRATPCPCRHPSAACTAWLRCVAGTSP